MISSTQRPLPDNTQQSKGTDIYAPGAYEPTISAGERSPIYVLDRLATANGMEADLHVSN